MSFDDQNGKEVMDNPNTPKFKKSEYSDGYFNPNGDLTENPFDAHQLEDWNGMNSRTENKLFGKGQKLSLPTDKDAGFRITFGRNSNTCDVVIDMDITGDYAERELAVSRNHFEIQKRTDGKWEVADLGSTNGVECSSVDKNVKSVNLKNTNEPWVLKDGDMLIIGGGPGTAGRLIGFRYYEKQGAEPCLIKFNATSVDDLASASGLYDSRPELLGKVSTESGSEKNQQEINEKGEHILELHKEVIELQKGGREKMKEFNDKSYSLQLTILETSKDLGDRFYQGDWSIAAGDLGGWAYQKGNAIIKNSDGGEPNDQDAQKAIEYLQLSTQLMELASRYRFQG